MKDALASYLHDHLAGATFAIEILEALRDGHPDEPVGQLARELLLEIEEDCGVLKALIDRVDRTGHSLKDAVSWISEKASRLKLRRQTHQSLGTYESVEALALGILGKEALWKALLIIAPDEPQLRGVDYELLVARARTQHARVEEQRLRLARLTFLDAVDSFGRRMEDRG